MSVRILTGDSLAMLKTLQAESVHCCVTSPPYWGLRNYQIDGQIGLEPTIVEHIESLVAVFREVRRVLRKDGVVFMNYGDAYATAPNGRSAADTKAAGQDDRTFRDKPFSTVTDGLKSKDLCMLPARAAIALQDDGWWIRSQMPWCLSGGAWLYARTQKGDGVMMLKDLARLDPKTVQLWTGAKWTRVISWTRANRHGRDGAFELVLRSGERIGCTAEHLWPLDRGNVRTDELSVGDVLRSCDLPEPDSADPPWLTGDAYWFAGLYLAEGCRAGPTGIMLTGHIKEQDRWERLKRFAKHYGCTVNLTERGNTQKISIFGPAAKAILRLFISGRTAHDKALTMAVWQLSNCALRLIMEGYLEGDGHNDGERIRLGFCRNYSLERDIRCAAARLGAGLTLKTTVMPNQDGEFPAFRGEWRWQKSEHPSAKNRNEIIEIRKSRARQFWDVSVEDKGHLFALASGILTHNCKRNAMPESVTDRPASSIEYVFQLTKSARYFWDGEAVRQAHQDMTGPPQRFGNTGAMGGQKPKLGGYDGQWDPGKAPGGRKYNPSGRNFRNSDLFFSSLGTPHGLISGDDGPLALDVNPAGFPGSHFATFPPKLIEPLIKAGTSERGCCPKCGAPWVREIKKLNSTRSGPQASGWRQADSSNLGEAITCGTIETSTLGWSPTCECKLMQPRPCTILDPFAGAGTTGLVADRLGRDTILIELNPEYVEMTHRRLASDAGMFAEIS